MRNGYCISSDECADNFVGVRFRDGLPEVVFPHGYNIPSDAKECRKDVFRLLSVLKNFSDRSEGDSFNGNHTNIAKLPITSYQYVIQDFLQNGYYVEKEVRYVRSIKGKVNWKRTIQQEKAHLDNGNIVYLSFQTKTSQIKDDNLLTQIHKYCVYQSFFRFGWLYLSTSYLPPEPPFKPDRKLFVSALKQAISSTFNDSKRKLFQSMLNIILDCAEFANVNDFSIGVYKFEGVWEDLVDYVFGETQKDKYFPHATWHIIKNKKVEKSSALEPDTVMKLDDSIYVLDAKYYQYGITSKVSDLPATSSIQKQITYGRYIAEHIGEVDPSKVYNAFIMPFMSPDNDHYRFVSVGTADWENYNLSTPNYAYVLGILVDTKWLITETVKHNDAEIEVLADLIEQSLKWYRNETETKENE